MMNNNDQNAPADYLIFDIETMSTCHNALVLSVSMIVGTKSELEEVSDDAKKVFQKLISKGITFRIDNDIQKKSGRKVDAKTVRFWQNHREALSLTQRTGDLIHPKNLYSEMQNYMMKNGYDNKHTTVWIRGPHFDAPILCNLFQEYLNLNVPTSPYNEFMIRDVRTALDVKTGLKTGYMDNFKEIQNMVEATKHFSLDDCALDILQLMIHDLI